MMYSSAPAGDAVESANAATGKTMPTIDTASTVRESARNAHSRSVFLELGLGTAGTSVLRMAHSPEERS
jgi:hypothetical protein